MRSLWRSALDGSRRAPAGALAGEPLSGDPPRTAPRRAPCRARRQAAGNWAALTGRLGWAWAGSLALLLSAAAPFLAGCRLLHGSPSAPVAAILATAHAAPGLRFGPVEEYPGERLYDFMDGAAVTYLDHHVQTMASADVFRGPDQAKVELYEMAAAADARELYAELTTSPGAPCAAGEAGCIWVGFEPEVLFRRGRFLVRLLGYAQDRDAATGLLAEIASRLDEQLDRR